MGNAYYANSMFTEAEQAFMLLADLADGVTKLRAFNKAISSTSIRGDYKRASELMLKAEENPVCDRLEQAIISFHKGSSLMGASKQLEAYEMCIKATKIFEEEYSLWTVSIFLNLLGAYYIFNGRL